MTPLRALLDELEADQRILNRGPLSYRPGAAEDVLARLESEFPKLPDDAKELLRWHDGQDAAAADGPGSGDHNRMHPAEEGTLNGVREMLAIGQAACKVRVETTFGRDGEVVHDVSLAAADYEVWETAC